MITFLFWNLKRNPLQEIVASLAMRREVDVIMLAECTIPPAVMLKSLNPPEKTEYHYARRVGCRTIEIFTRFRTNSYGLCTKRTDSPYGACNFLV